MSISVERVTALINLCYCYCVQHNKVKFLRLLQRFYFTFLSSLCIKRHPIPQVLSLLVWFIPWTMAETKAYNEVLNYLRDNEYPIDFSKDQKRNLRKKALQCKIRSWRWCAVFHWPEKRWASKMGSLPRRAAEDTESLSLWQTCWTL